MNATLSRRNALSMMAGAAFAVSAPLPRSLRRPLGSIAAKNGFVFGAAAGPVIDKDAAIAQLYIDQTKIITSDIALKMSRVAPGRVHCSSKRPIVCTSSAQAQHSDARSLPDLERVGSRLDQGDEQCGT